MCRGPNAAEFLASSSLGPGTRRDTAITASIWPWLTRRLLCRRRWGGAANKQMFRRSKPMLVCPRRSWAQCRESPWAPRVREWQRELWNSNQRRVVSLRQHLAAMDQIIHKPREALSPVVNIKEGPGKLREPPTLRPWKHPMDPAPLASSSKVRLGKGQATSQAPKQEQISAGW